MALEPAKLSDFTMAGALGSGTTARVYEATHAASGRPVAIKLMESSSTSDIAPRPHEMRERFAREALLLAGVESRHVSKILGYGFEKGQPFLVLERLRGETLDSKLRRDGPVPPPIAARWIEQLIVGVRDCHDAKIIHRDIKPSNIFIHRDEHGGELVKLIDFGVARLREITGDTGLTSTNHLIGSMGYMAPEQFKSARSVGYSADLYAIGVVVFRTLTGRLPFVSRSLEAVIRMKSEDRAPAISSMSPIQSPLLDWFVQKAMARDPEARFRSAREMLEQWWAVTQNLDGGTPDVMRGAGRDVVQGVGRLEESYAVPTRRRPSAPPTRRATQPIPPPSAAQTVAHVHAQRELSRLSARASPGSRRPPRPPMEWASTISDAPPTEAEHEPPPTIPRVRSADRVAHDAAPRTLPSQRLVEETTDVGIEPVDLPVDDPFDLPTRNDPNLRKLVERELELQKTRKRRG